MQPPSTLTRNNWPPDYIKVFAWRQHQLLMMREDPAMMFGALAYYANNPVAFINHWVDTFDPRNALNELPTRLPMIMFQRQAELVEFLFDCLSDQENGLIDKSRDMGATWVCAAFSVWLWLFREGSSVGWGSRKEQLVDKLGDPDSIFEKMRMIIRGLPDFFMPRGFSFDSHSTYMKMINPENGSTITGEAGNNIGRGGRKTIYFKDESAHYEHPESIEASLGDNTNVQIDISTVNGVGTVFDRKRNSGLVWLSGTANKIKKGMLRIFILDWSDHPTKDKAWHAKREQAAKDAGLLHVFRQEVDRDAAASIQGIIIPPEWARAAVDAHLDLKFGDDGLWSGALDVADEGGDLNALTFRKGVVLRHAEDWGDGDTGFTTRQVVASASGKLPITIQYDCIGVGAGVKAEANRLAKEKLIPKTINFMPWNAGASVLNPEERVIPSDSNSPLNKDFYANLKAQGWWALRRRFEKTYRARTEGIKYNPAELISLDSKMPKLQQVLRELSQPAIDHDGKMRLIVDKKPEGARSPNLADSIMMNYFPLKLPMIITDALLSKAGMPYGR